MPYIWAAIIAAEVTIIGNFLLQERFVFADMHRRPRRMAAVRRLLRFNNAEALIRIPVMALMVETWHISSVLATGDLPHRGVLRTLPVPLPRRLRPTAGGRPLTPARSRPEDRRAGDAAGRTLSRLPEPRPGRRFVSRRPALSERSESKCRSTTGRAGLRRRRGRRRVQRRLDHLADVPVVRVLGIDAACGRELDRRDRLLLRLQTRDRRSTAAAPAAGRCRSGPYPPPRLS